MNVQLSNGFMNMMLPALTLQLAVAVKNSTEQSPEFPLAEFGGMPAKALFAVSWAGIAFSIFRENKKNKTKALIAAIGAASIVAAVFHVKASKKAGTQPNTMVAMLFPVGWVLTAAAIFLGNNGPLRYLSFVGAAMVLYSMMVVLPWQRKNNVVDGPGYNLFSSAFVLLGLANGVKSLK